MSLSEVQVGCIEHVPELLALGIPDWRLAHLPKFYNDLLADVDHILIGHPKD
ncbi:MAG: hypothetical protein U0Z26_02135 [Anaerolineales bacterium]